MSKAFTRLLLFVSLICAIYLVGYYQPVQQAAAMGSMPALEPIGSLSGASQAVDVQGNYAYVGFQNIFKIIDVTDPTNPFAIGELDIGEYIAQILVSGSFAYVIEFNGLHILDISDSQNIVEKAFYAYSDGDSIHIEDGLIYVFYSGGVEILSIAGGAELVLVGRYELNIQGTYDMAVSNKNIFINGRYPGEWGVVSQELSVIDARVPSHPKLKFQQSLGMFKMHITNNKLLVVDVGCSSTCYGYFDYFEFDPETYQLTFIGQDVKPNVTGSFGIISDQFLAYVARDTSLDVFNIYNPWSTQAPRLVGSYSISRAHDMVTTGNQIYVTSDAAFYVIAPFPTNKTYIPIITYE